MTTIKTVQVPSRYHMVSFDVKSLFTNVPLEYIIGLVLEQIFNKGELVTNITRSEMKEMLLFYMLLSFQPQLGYLNTERWCCYELLFRACT